MTRIPHLVAISDRHRRVGPWDAWCAALARAGVPALWVREKDLDDREILALAGRARSETASAMTILVSDRADLALAAGADGVHLSSTGLPTAAARRRFGDRLLLGRSTHELDEVRRARDEGADYVAFGPVFCTPGKTASAPPIGLAGLAAACRVGIPVVALGGVDWSNWPAVVAAGAHGAAAIRPFLDPRDLAAIPPAALAGVRE